MYNSLVFTAVLTMTIALSSCSSGGLGLAIGIKQEKWMEQKFIFSEIITEPDVFAPIKSIALLNIPNPHYYLPYYLEVEPTVAGKETKRYEGFNFSVIAQQRLKEYLKEEGYHVILVSVNRDNRYKLLDDYSRLNIPEADAFLDLAPVEVGFKKNPWNPFASEVGPHVSVVVRLVSAKSKKILYAESVQYGYDKNPLFDSTRIDSPPDDYFEDMNTLKSKNEKAVEQLAHGVDAISRAIAERLSR